MWTDPYISKQLLEIHLNFTINLGSRKITAIENTLSWILKQVPGKQLSVADLGCGPGLYTERLAERGYVVTGVDYSEHSIGYARKMAEKKGLDIDYCCTNYLELEMEENQFDLVLLIYTDFGVLLPHERARLLSFVYKVLKPGGIFIFDALNNREMDQKKVARSWGIYEKGFWTDKPYLALSDSFFYEEEQVVLYQHLVVDERDNVDVYRFWTHFFSDNDLEAILRRSHFSDCHFHTDVLAEEGDSWNGNKVTFCVAQK